MQTFHLNSTDINYIDYGDKSFPAMVFANSLGSNFDIWNDVAMHFKDDFRIVQYDKRGHGGSSISHTHCSISDLGHDLASLLSHLNINEAIICGISVGGMIAQSVATTNPNLVKALVLCDTGAKIGTDDFWLERIKAVNKNGLEPISDNIIERWFSKDFKLNRSDEMVHWRQMLNKTSKEGYMAVCNALKKADLSVSSSTIKQPTLCIVGDEDLSTPPELVEALSNMIEGSSLKIIENAGHLPCIEKPETMANHIREFLKENNLV